MFYLGVMSKPYRINLSVVPELFGLTRLYCNLIEEIANV